MVEHQSGSGMPNPDQIAELRARVDAGDRDAAGRLGELLAEHGDQAGALRVWAQAYGDGSPTTKRLTELLVEQGDLAGAVGAWRASDAVRQNPECSHAAFLNTLDGDERLDYDDEPEDWGFVEAEWLARLLAERGDAAAIAELRARADAGDPAAAKRLSG